MRIALYCATPYHVLVSVILAINKDEGDMADIYLLNHFEDASRLVEALREIGLFDHIYLIDQKSISFLSNAKRTVQAVLPPKIIREMACQRSYDRMCFFALDFINISYIVKKTLLRNIECEFFFAEDGLGSYVEKIYTPNRAARSILKLLRRSQYIDKVNKLALIEPDLLSVETSREIVRIPLIPETKRDQFTDYILQLWPGDVDITHNDKYIYCQSVASELQSVGYKNGEQNILQVMKDLKIEGSTVFKPHPRELSYFIPDVGRMLFDKRPFEAIISQTNLSEKVLITSISSCMYTAYLIFRQYPKVIVINDIVNGKRGAITEELNVFLNKLSLILPHGDLLFIPKNLQEFTEILKNSRTD